MINKQKLWFLTLFSLILVLSVYYITMPTEVLTASKTNDNKKNITSKSEVKVTEENILTSLELEKDEERSSEVTKYNEILTNKDSIEEEKNNAYDGIKQIDEIKAKEESIEKKIKEKLKLDSFIKIEGNNVSVVAKKKDHDYSLANNIMRLINEEFKDKVYITVKFQK